MVNGEYHYSQTTASVDTAYLLTISPNGTSQTQQLTRAPNSLLYPGAAIPDGSGGVLASWTSSPSLPFHLTHVATDGNTAFDFPLNGGRAGMALGTNGTAFATDGTNTVAFSISSGQQLWSFAGSLIEATYGGGASLFDSQGNVVQLDSQGTAGTSVSCSLCLAPFTGNLWTALSGVAGLLFGPDQDVEVSAFPLLQGSRENQNASPKPAFTHFLPVNPGLGYNASQFVTDMTSRGYVPPTVGDHTFKTAADATVNAFREAVAKPTGAVAFIGHAAYAQRPDGTFYSVGLCFFDNCIQRKPSSDPNAGDLFYSFYPPESRPVTMSVIPNQARVIFIASCYVGKVFTDFWGRDYSSPNTSKGRAIIVPASINPLINPTAGAVNLIPGKDAWLWIATKLAEGHSVTDAISGPNGANERMNALHYVERWTSLGDPDHATIAILGAQ
jgi:hypothetical protein